MPNSKKPMNQRFAARRLARGKSTADVATLSSRTIEEIDELRTRREFSIVIEEFAELQARSSPEQMDERRDLTLDALDSLVDDLNASSVHWVAGKMRIFDSEATFDGGHDDWTTFEDYYMKLPPAMQEDYRRFDPGFIPPDLANERDDEDQARRGNLIAFPGSELPPKAKADPEFDSLDGTFTYEQDPALMPLGADIVYDDILHLADEPEDEVASATSAPTPDSPAVKNEAETRPDPPKTFHGKPFTYWAKDKIPPHLR